MAEFNLLVSGDFCCLTRCGARKSPTNPVSVSGVGPEGKPLGDVRVGFESAENQDLAVRTTDSSGLAMMKTESLGEGVAAGRQRVAVCPPIDYVNFDRPHPKSSIPSKLNSYESSGLEFTVKPGGTSDFTTTISRN